MIGDDGRLSLINIDPVPDHRFATVVGTSALLAPLEQTIDQLVVGNLERQHQIDRRAVLFHNLVESLGLRRRARKTVENVSFALLMLRHIVGDQVNHQSVGSQLPLVDKALHAEAKRRPLTNFLEDHLAGRYVVKPVFLDQSGSLRSFAGPRRTEQHDIQHRNRNLA